MRFKDRIKLEDEYNKWRRDNEVKDCAYSVITFLEIKNILKDCDKCKYKKAIEEQMKIAELAGRIKKVPIPGSITDE